MTPLSLVPGRNCWRVASADRLSLIVDGQAYFRAMRQALLSARHLVVMIGWDFDFEIEMLPGDSDAQGNAPDGLPNRVGPFLDALVERRPDLDIYLLKWSGGALIAPGRAIPAFRIKLMSPDQIHLAFDGRHPIGACHHQKIVVVDDALAFCGGLDVTEGRWDTPEHLSGDPRRRLRSGEIAQAWHDAAAMMSGPAAQALGELARARWLRANDAPLPEPVPDPAPADLWPEKVAVDFRDLPVAIARTEPPERDTPAVVEIEQLYLDAIAAARHTIYIESQYFAADSITRAVAARLAEPDGPEVLVINPEAAQNAVEDAAMHVTRSRMMLALQARDRFRRFRMVHPVNAADEPIYVHAKLLIVDDIFLRVGSSNIDRRSMGFDTEADVAVLARTDADRDRIRAIRANLLAEHLGSTVDRVQAVIAECGGLIPAIDRLNPEGPRRLEVLIPRDPGPLGRLLSHSRFFDPRYRRSARSRLGLTNRHLFMGLGALGLAAVLLARRRR
ncbi:phospholipase D-like domain-containing protein [Paracoccus sp. (in: a-proteobacteria)]|uniref:phospholipase D-like domain-containing protein n=1 Tax=Paracoccus sp. TaxID=267 RepID=UPI0026E09A75|nr:phospholipase D-like domain-containing protein [Paracoccus sp. (in: a-proteobacteria)]MDO5370394.1 phospholipase D-like domain-containing protein [Paracoccus sp. (in: a-proteobacteria)]